MMKLAQRAALLAVMALGLFAGSANAQKIAVIDTRAVLAALPEAQAANQKLENIRKMWMDSLQLMQTQYQAKMDAYSKVGETATADAKKKFQEDLAGLEQTFMKFREAKFGQEGELTQVQQQLLQPIFDKVKAALENFAKKEKFMMIVDKANAIFADASIDLTTKFSEYLKTAK